MATTAFVYGTFVDALFTAKINRTSDTFKGALYTSSYTPNQDTDSTYTTTNEVVGTGYTAGGLTLASPTLTYTSGTNTWAFTCTSPLTWTNTTLTNVKYLIVYDFTASPKQLICYADFGTAQTTSAQDFVYTVSASGLVSLTVA